MIITLRILFSYNLHNGHSCLIVNIHIHMDIGCIVNVSRNAKKVRSGASTGKSTCTHIKRIRPWTPGRSSLPANPEAPGWPSLPASPCKPWDPFGLDGPVDPVPGIP